MKDIDLNKIILDFVHSETGWGNPLRPGCEFEDLFLDEPEKLEGNKIRVTFRYSFDRLYWYQSFRFSADMEN